MIYSSAFYADLFCLLFVVVYVVLGLGLFIYVEPRELLSPIVKNCFLLLDFHKCKFFKITKNLYKKNPTISLLFFSSLLLFIMSLKTMSLLYQKKEQDSYLYNLIQPYPKCKQSRNSLKKKKPMTVLLKTGTALLFFFFFLLPGYLLSLLDFLSRLPFEIVFEIIYYLNTRDLCQLSMVSTSWYRNIRTNDIWRKRSQQYYKNMMLSSNKMIDWYHIHKQHHILNHRWNIGRVMTHYLIGHTDSVYCLQFDKQKIITGSRDKTIKCWDLSTYQCVKTLVGHEGSVLCLKYNRDIMISGSSDTTLIVWNMHTLEPVMRLQGHTAGVLDICFNSDYIFSCSKDKTIRIWDIHTGQLLKTLHAAHRGPINSIQLHGHHLVSASGDTFIKLWDIRTGECIRKFEGHTRGLACVRYDGKTIVSGSNDKTIKVWNAETGQCLMNLEGHTDLVRSLSVSNDRIISASYDQSIRVWDMKTGTCLLNFQSGHSSWVFDVGFDSTKIVR